MSFDSNYRAEAAIAMELAAKAASEVERVKWLRIALAWQELTRLPHVDLGQQSSQDPPRSLT